MEITTITAKTSNNCLQKEGTPKAQMPKAESIGGDPFAVGMNFKPTEEGQKLWEQAYLQRVLEQMQEAQKDDGDKKNPASDSVKAMRIARNIMKGNIVPAKDEKFLLEYNAELYKAAKNIAMLKESGEKVKSELKKEDCKQSAFTVAGLETGGCGEGESAEGQQSEIIL